MAGINGLALSVALLGIQDEAQRVELLRKLQASTDRTLLDRISALEERIRTLEARLGIESPELPPPPDPVSALEQMITGPRLAADPGDDVAALEQMTAASVESRP